WQGCILSLRVLQRVPTKRATSGDGRHTLHDLPIDLIGRSAIASWAPVPLRLIVGYGFIGHGSPQPAGGHLCPPHQSPHPEQPDDGMVMIAAQHGRAVRRVHRYRGLPYELDCRPTLAAASTMTS